MRLVEKIGVALWGIALLSAAFFWFLPLEWKGSPYPPSVTLLAILSAFAVSLSVFFRESRLRRNAEHRLARRDKALELLRGIASVANETSSSDAVLTKFLPQICGLFDFQIAHVYQPSAGGQEMASTGIWYDTDNSRFLSFKERRQALSFPRGYGLPGSVLKSGEPNWRPDLLQEKDCPRTPWLLEVGLRSGVAFPITAHGRLQAVVEFFCERARTEDGFILDLMGQIGHQVGVVMARERAASAQSQSDERFRRLAEVSSEGIIVHKGGLVIETNPAALSQLGYSLDEARGREIFDFLAPEYRDRQRLRVSSGDESVHQVELLRKDGTRFPAEIFGKNVEIDGESARVALFRDFTSAKRVQEAIRNSEQRFRRLAEATCEAVVIHRDLKILEVNQSFLELFGFKQVEDVLGQHLMELVAPVSRDTALSCIARESRAGEEIQVETARGERRTVELRCKGQIDPQRPEVPSVVTLLDVTERRTRDDRLQEEETRMSVMLDQVPACLWSIDLNYKITSSTGSGLKGLGVRPGELVGISLFQYLGTDDPNFPSVVAHRRALNGETVRYETAWTGRIFRTHLEPVRSPDGKIKGAIGVAMDVTVERQSQDRLRAAADELLRSNRDLEQFAYVASHDLQEPLRMISSYIELLGHRYRGKIDSDADTFIRFASEGAKRMKLQIDDLLLYSRVHRNGCEFAGVDCGSAVDRACANLRLMIEEAGVKFEVQDLPRVRGDESQIVLLFQNLIGNAIKFRRSDSSPYITVNSVQEQGHWVFTVTDNGIGIDMKYADRIFNIFQRLHSSTEYPGTGIGLAICKKIVERHGGRIWVESEPEQGSRFRFALPVGPWEVSGSAAQGAVRSATA